MNIGTRKSAALIGAGAVGLTATAAHGAIQYTDAGNITGSDIYFNLQTGAVAASSFTDAEFELSVAVTTGSDAVSPKNPKTITTYRATGLANATVSGSVLASPSNGEVARVAPETAVGPSGNGSFQASLIYEGYVYGGTGTGTPPPTTDWSLASPTNDGFVGLQISNSSTGDLNYGWAHITLNGDNTISLHDFAYEDVANTAIPAGVTSVPEPSCAAALIAGAAGAAALVRRRRMAAR